MLADVVEAAARSLSDPTPGKIEGLIRKVIKDRLDDGQLDQSDLTLRDLDRAAAVFAKVLTGVYHHRVPYPDKEKGI
jgi:membrane-associated HD superfamily phosphohydrolase